MTRHEQARMDILGEIQKANAPEVDSPTYVRPGKNAEFGDTKKD